jgi:hypothetical protein
MNSGLTGEVAWLAIAEETMGSGGGSGAVGARGRSSSSTETQTRRVQQMPATMVKGEIWLSQNFLVFATPDKRLVLVVVPLTRIATFDRRVTLVGGGAPMRLVVRDGEDLFFCVSRAAPRSTSSTSTGAGWSTRSRS